LKILEDIALAPLTTLGIGGPARWFVRATSEAEIAEACAWARERGVPLFVLGGGSNLLVADAGFDGLALRVAFMGTELDGERLRAAAGVPWEHCVQQTTEAGLAGIECLAGIPGTVGGTPVQNVGAYGQEVASVIERVRAFDRTAEEFVEFTNAECGFSYRKSRFNTTDRGRYVVTQVDYRLRQNGVPTLNYEELKAHFSGRQKTPTLTEVAEAVRGIRRSKGMLLIEGDPDCRSVGSFFKNPVVAKELVPQIAKEATGLSWTKEPPQFPAGPQQVKLSAAWLIEEAGFYRGYRMGKAGISRRHTLALVNYGDADEGGATAVEILALAEKIQGAVEARFSIWLEMEPEMVGF
jgi:UDP-N-acetylmuramate dehydrogenase